VEPFYHSMRNVLDRAILLEQEVSISEAHPPIEHLPALTINRPLGGHPMAAISYSTTGGFSQVGIFLGVSQCPILAEETYSYPEPRPPS
jgi:hypothetical protein